MSDSEALDLDSLLELMDDDIGDEAFVDGEKKDTTKIDLSSSSNATASRSKELRSAFENALSPQRIVNPKENETPHDEYPAYIKDSFLHSKETKEDSDDESHGLSEFGKKVQKELSFQKNSVEERRLPHIKPTTSTWKMLPKQSNVSESNLSGSSSFVDVYSGIRILNPLVSFDALQQRMQGRKMIKMSFMKNFIRNGDIEGDWVTIGVLVGKLPTKQTKTGRAYSIWKMSDLHDPEKIISVFLFSSAHAEHWKTTIGTVIGILNPKLSQDKDKGGLSLTVDHPGKLMIMGKSKDFGHCKSKRKDGSPCTAVVNLFQCEYCMYHVKHEYQKFSSGRSELQAVYTGKEPNLKNKIMKKQNIIYGGQMYITNEKKPSKKNKTKDKLTLSNLTLKRKADALENEVRESGVKKLTEMYGSEISKAVENNSEFINSQLAIPSVGSRNLLRHLTRDKVTRGDAPVKMISAKELLKMRDSQFNSRGVNHNIDNLTMRNLMPQLGKGLRPGQNVSLDTSHLRTIYNPLDLAKLKAIKKIQERGELKAKNPNSVKVSSNSASKVKAVLERSLDEKTDSPEEKSAVVQSKLGSIDLNSERVKEMLNRKSSHAYEVEMAEMEKEAAYFNTLEKKERMEEKMASTTEVVCDVVSCKKCKYTAQSAAERCIKESHPLKCHKALKRFFACKDCGWRSCSFKRYPSSSCRGCKGSNFERTTVLKPRSGPKLDSEILNIRGDESKFLDSLSSQAF